ncbi:UNVERIFIED_CONTAM: hypothetical protein FKN15_030290 [Acipenser sinensis]
MNNGRQDRFVQWLFYSPTAKNQGKVIQRYKKILSTYRKGHNMSQAFRHQGVDRNPIAATAPIAEFAMANPSKYKEMEGFDLKKQKLLDFSKKSVKLINSETKCKIQLMKKQRALLPLT